MGSAASAVVPGDNRTNSLYCNVSNVAVLLERYLCNARGEREVLCSASVYVRGNMSLCGPL